MNDRPSIRTRLHIAEPIASGARIAVDKARAHFLRRVLRLDAGDPIGVFNGDDGEWLATIERFNRNDAELNVEACYRPPTPEPGPWLMFAPVKRNRTDMIIEKATELGVERLLPIFTRRTVASRMNLERAQATAMEAAEQTERLTLPMVTEPCDLTDALADLPAGIPLLFCAESGEAAPIADVLSARTGGPPPIVLIGPEGGFTPDEQRTIRKHPGCIAASLGPRLLRAETAVIAALACVQAICGDWRQRPPHRNTDDWRFLDAARGTPEAAPAAQD